MALTFYPTTGAHSFGFSCLCGEVHGEEVFFDFETAYGEYLERILGRGELPICYQKNCQGNPVVIPLDTPFLSVNNSQGAFLLDNLGWLVERPWEERMKGRLDSGDLLGRILLAEALAPEDEGLPWESGNPRAAGFLQRSLQRLQEIVEFAETQGSAVSWY